MAGWEKPIEPEPGYAGGGKSAEMVISWSCPDSIDAWLLVIGSCDAEIYCLIFNRFYTDG